jgi:hypothetical protein
MKSLRGKLGWLPPIPHHGYILREVQLSAVSPSVLNMPELFFQSFGMAGYTQMAKEKRRNRFFGI